MGESLEKEEIAVSPTPSPEPTAEPTVEPTEAPVVIPTVKYVPPITVVPTVAVAPTTAPEAPKNQITVCAQGKCETTENKPSNNSNEKSIQVESQPCTGDRCINVQSQ